MEDIIKDLKEDKKRAWEVINSLNERLSKAEKQETDPVLHYKLDKLLEKLEKQTELENNVVILRDEFEKSQGYIAHFVESHEELRETMKLLKERMETIVTEIGKSKEMDKLIDTVQTTEGYVELFVKDFDKIHGKLNEIEGQIENTRRLEQKLDLVVDQGRKLQDEVNGNKNEISKLLLEIQKTNQKIEIISELWKPCLEMAADIKCQKLDIDGLKQEMVKKFTEPKVVYKCFNSNCRTVLTKNLVLREDGVSVLCPKLECITPNIIETLKKGYKWMSCNGNVHYQQHPLDRKHAESGICLICGKDGILYDECKSAIISIENTETDAKNSIGASYFVKKALKVKGDSEKVNKCWNSNCNSVLPKNIAFKEDGVSVTCPNSACRYPYIVGSLKEGNRWFRMRCNGNTHFQQFPLNTKYGEKKKCQICGVEGPVVYGNAHTAMRE